MTKKYKDYGKIRYKKIIEEEDGADAIISTEKRIVICSRKSYWN